MKQFLKAVDKSSKLQTLNQINVFDALLFHIHKCSPVIMVAPPVLSCLPFNDRISNPHNDHTFKCMIRSKI